MTDKKTDSAANRMFYTWSCNSADCIHRIGMKCKFPVMGIDKNGDCVAYKRKEKEK